MSVEKTLPEVETMACDLEIVRPLMGGTKAMRSEGERLLPRWPNEDKEAHATRIKVSTLFPAYKETVHNMTGRVFADDVSLDDDVPEQIAEYALDIDREGNNISVWAESWFKKALAEGVAFALVDVPHVENVVTKADEKAAGVRPYVVKINAGQVIGWRSTGGKLTQFRYSETVSEDDGDFGVETIKQIRVLEPGKWATYRKPDDKGDYVLHEEGTTSLDYIPIVPLFTGRTGYMTATPPLLELAHQNVKHWQSQSDQDNILHVARVPILTVNTDNDEFSLTVGGQQAVKLGLDGKLAFVEHSGAGITAGRDSLKDLIEEMRLSGAKLIQVDKSSTKTATQAGEENATETSPLQRMAQGLEDALDNILQAFADFMGLGDGGKCQVNGNFDEDFAPEVSLPFLLNMANAGKLSDETLFAEAQRRRIISPERVWDEEKEKLEMQGPSLGGLIDTGEDE
jgi:hypothetical protein